MKYRPEVDGLRALAVLPVILFHAGFDAPRGGFIGVDVFFVISGYLITRLIREEMQTDTFSIVRFYERRIRRILPALFLVCFACIPLAWQWLTPRDFKSFGGSMIAVVGFVSNIYFWKTENYFAAPVERLPLVHTWSLAVEEQFYLFFPLVLLALRGLRRMALVAVIAAIAFVSLAIAEYWSGSQPSASFYLLPARAWELGAGALLALTHDRWSGLSGTKREFCSAAALAAVGYSLFAFEATTRHPGLITLLPVMGTVVLLAVATPDTAVGRVLSSRPLVALGLISYSAYLWHQPLFAFARIRLPTLSLVDKAVLVAVALVLAYLSWRFVERPFRAKGALGRGRVFALAAVASAAALAIGVLAYVSDGLPGRIPKESQAVLAFLDYDKATLYRQTKCYLTPEDAVWAFSEECRQVSLANSTILWGDSHAAGLSHGLRRLLPDVIQYTAGNCPPLKDVEIRRRPKCRSLNAFVLQEIGTIKPKTVVLAAEWRSYLRRDRSRSFAETIAYIRKASPSSKIVIIGSLPQWQPSLPELMFHRGVTMDRERWIAVTDYESLAAADRFLEGIAAANSVTFISVIKRVCDGPQCPAVVMDDGILTLTAWDHAHLTAGGSVRLARAILGVSEP